ncbi:MAG: PAS domain-containing protein [Bacteroidales bacterium]|nr:PAS domain-containing protein [Bacteroidales bacterium]
MNLKLSLKNKLLLYIIYIPAAIFIISSLYIKNRYINTTILQYSEFSENQLIKQAKSYESSYTTIINQITSVTSIIEGGENLPFEQKKQIINKTIQNLILKNSNINSIWIDWELNYVDKSWNKPFGRERQLFKKDLNSITRTTEILDSLNENVHSLHNKCKISAQEFLSNPNYITKEGKITNDYYCEYVYPVIINGKIIGTIGTEIQFNDYAFENKYKGFSLKSFLLSSEGTILICPDKNLIGKNISWIFNEKTIEKYNLNKIIKNCEELTFVGQSTILNNKYIYSFLPAKIIENSQNWIFVISLPFELIKKIVNKKFYSLLLIGLLVILILGFIIYKIGNHVSQSLFKTNKILENLSYGDINEEYKLKINGNAEIEEINHSLNNLIDGLNKTASFAKEIGKGKLEIEYEKLSDKDTLGESLIEMKESLLHAKIEENMRKTEDSKQNWLTQGLAKFSDILRESTDNLEDFSFNIISNLVKYVNVNQGGLFIINENEEKEKFIELIACYAYERKKYIEKKIKYGEGLIGRCILEKEKIYLEEVPDDYINITSGLGKDTPRSLLIVPLILNEEVYGAIELASFKKFEKHEIEFVEKLGQSIASTISNVKINLRTASLLEETRTQAEELAAQEEEMRQNLEELQATQEESARREAELSSLFNAMNASLLVAELDLEGKIITINNDYAKLLNKNKNDLIGENYKNIVASYGSDEVNINRIWNSLKSGEIIKNTICLIINNKEIWINQTFAPILNTEGHITKVLNIGTEITEMKLHEQQVNKLLKESQIKNDELLKAQEEITFEKYLFDMLLENVPQRVLFKNRESKFIRVSRSLVKKIGVKDAKEVINKSDFDFLKPEFAEKTFQDEQNIMKTKKALVNFEEYEKTPEGKEIWKVVSKIPMIDEKGECIGLFGIINEISDFKKLEKEAIQKSQELEMQKKELLNVQEEMEKEKTLMDALMENIPDSIYFKDQQSRFIRASHSMVKKFQVSSIEKLYGKTDFDFHGKQHAQEAFNDEQNIIKTGKPIINIVEKEEFDDGRLSWGSTTKMPLKDKEGKIIGTFGITKDITELKNLEIELLEKNKKLEQIVKEKGSNK